MAFDFKKEDKALYTAKTTPSFVDVPAMTFFAVAGAGNPNDEDGSYAEALAVLYALSYTIKMAKMGDWQPEGYFDYVVPPLEGLWWGVDAVKRDGDTDGTEYAGDQKTRSSGVFDGIGIRDKSALQWVALIRQPDFVTDDVCIWAKETVAKKKSELAKPSQYAIKADCDGTESAGSATKTPRALDRAHLVQFAEGSCAQILHKGPYDDEPATIAALEAFIESESRKSDITNMDILAKEGEDSHAKHDSGASDTVRDGDRAGELVMRALDAAGGVPPIRLHHEIYLGDPRRVKPENLRTIIRHPVR